MDFRKDFPILKTKISGQKMVYFDNAATTQKPRSMIEAVADFYSNYNTNIHRGLDPLSAKATSAYEKVRQDVARFIEADSQEIIFTKSATESINLVARSWGEKYLKAGDRVVLSVAEHHANIVPWLQLQKKIGIKIDYIPVLSNGDLDMKTAIILLSQPRVKILSLSLASNVLGLINPLVSLLKKARQKKIISLLDATQVVAHQAISVKKLSSDFLVFSAHKLYGPTGVGGLYGRADVLSAMPPFLGGGAMIQSVSQKQFRPAEACQRFEAGTANIAGVIGLGASLTYLKKIGWVKIKKQEKILTDYFLAQLKERPKIKLWGQGNNKLPLFSLSFSGLHSHDVADLLGRQGIIVRAGHHCAEPLHHFLKLPATLRVSLSFYNTKKEIDYFFNQLDKLLLAFVQNK